MIDLLQHIGPPSWGVASVLIWLTYVMLKGWHALTVWERRQVAFGVFTALLFLNFLTMDQEFQGWSDVYYFCGRQLQYCTCTFRWNALGWAKAYVLWSFVLSSAAGLQRVVIQLGLNGLLPGEEVVTRESIVSICWRLIPYWLNNWEQQWGAECSSMMFELPHFAVELLVILPCIQILCARLKILAMPLVQIADVPAPDAAAAGVDMQAALPAAPVNGAAAAAGGRGGRGGRRGRRGGLVVFSRDDFAPNILKGYWERKPEQKHLLPRLRANLQVMLFATAVTALAACNALLVPLALEASVIRNPSTHVIQAAGLHPDWFAESGLNRTALPQHSLTRDQEAMLTARLAAFNTPRRSLASATGMLFPVLWGGTPHSTYDMPGGRAPVERSTGPILTVTQAVWRQVSQAPLRAALADRSFLGLVNALLGMELWEAMLGWPSSAGDVLMAAQRSMAATDDEVVRDVSGIVSRGVQEGDEDVLIKHVIGAEDVSTGQEEEGEVHEHELGTVSEDACSGHLSRFKSNLGKHTEEIHKMKAAEHRALIPLVESALAVMRLSCEKYFVLLSVFVAHLLFREHPPRTVRAIIRFNARLSTAFQKVILYSFPAVCWVYGAGMLFSLFVSAVFWGSPIIAAYESLRSAISTVRIQSLRHATEAELERMGGNCTICWGDMHIGHAPPASRANSDSTAAASPTAAQADTAGAAAGAVTAGATAETAADTEDADGDARSAAAGRRGRGRNGTRDRGSADGTLSEDARAWSLPCGHAYHHGCLSQWLTQCHTNGMTPTCPMCQAAIRLEVRWRFPQWKWPENEHFQRGFNDAMANIRAGQQGGQGGAGAADRGGPGHPAHAWRRVVPGEEEEEAANGGRAVAPGAVANDVDSDNDSDDDDDDELGVMMMPVMNGGGIGRQRPAAGRVRGGAAGGGGVGGRDRGGHRHENLLLPPPMAALGNMNMLQLLDYQRELQELLQDMPQIPPPDDVAQLQMVAVGQQPAAPAQPAPAAVQQQQDRQPAAPAGAAVPGQEQAPGVAGVGQPQVVGPGAQQQQPRVATAVPLVAAGPAALPPPTQQQHQQFTQQQIQQQQQQQLQYQMRLHHLQQQLQEQQQQGQSTAAALDQAKWLAGEAANLTKVLSEASELHQRRLAQLQRYSTGQVGALTGTSTCTSNNTSASTSGHNGSGTHPAPRPTNVRPRPAPHTHTDSLPALHQFGVSTGSGSQQQDPGAMMASPASMGGLGMHLGLNGSGSPVAVPSLIRDLLNGTGSTTAAVPANGVGGSQAVVMAPELTESIAEMVTRCEMLQREVEVIQNRTEKQKELHRQLQRRVEELEGKREQGVTTAGQPAGGSGAETMSGSTEVNVFEEGYIRPLMAPKGRSWAYETASRKGAGAQNGHAAAGKKAGAAATVPAGRGPAATLTPAIARQAGAMQPGPAAVANGTATARPYPGNAHGRQHSGNKSAVVPPGISAPSTSEGAAADSPGTGGMQRRKPGTRWTSGSGGGGAVTNAGGTRSPPGRGHWASGAGSRVVEHAGPSTDLQRRIAAAEEDLLELTKICNAEVGQATQHVAAGIDAHAAEAQAAAAAVRPRRRFLFFRGK